MAQYRLLVTRRTKEALDQADSVVTTFYLDTDALSGADDPQALCEDAADLFGGSLVNVKPFNEINVRAYDMSDAVPRLPAGDASMDLPVGVDGGPREVALCLSYFAGRNVPRLRGRMYIGPFSAAVMAQRPSSTEMGRLTALAEGISGLGGVNVQWVQYSPTTGDFTNVSDYWVDDEWDTVRSRGLRGTTRLTGTVSG